MSPQHPSLSFPPLPLSVEVANFPEYTRPLIDHLSQIKLLHWDLYVTSEYSALSSELVLVSLPLRVVRETAAKALRKLTPLDTLYMREAGEELILVSLCVMLSCVLQFCLPCFLQSPHLMFVCGMVRCMLWQRLVMPSVRLLGTTASPSVTMWGQTLSKDC